MNSTKRLQCNPVSLDTYWFSNGDVKNYTKSYIYWRGLGYIVVTNPPMEKV